MLYVGHAGVTCECKSAKRSCDDMWNRETKGILD